MLKGTRLVYLSCTYKYTKLIIIEAIMLVVYCYLDTEQVLSVKHNNMLKQKMHYKD